MRAALSVLLETLLAALMAPVTMYIQSRGVAEVLSGRDSGWESQRRDDGSLPLSALLRNYGGLSLFGLLIGAMAYAISPVLALWMSPVIAGMVLAIPVVALTSAHAPARRCCAWGCCAFPKKRRHRSAAAGTGTAGVAASDDIGVGTAKRTAGCMGQCSNVGRHNAPWAIGRKSS